MEISFLGGASGVGASSLLVRSAGRTVLIDAGVRVGRNHDPLPDLSPLQNAPLDAVLITHAHADHIGALPLVARMAPHAPLYASRATIRLMEVMLRDALNIQRRRAADELEIPLFDEPAVQAVLERLRPLPLEGSLRLPEAPEWELSTSRAGHIAGALSFGIATPEARLVVSGDISLTPQRTVGAARLPALRRPDLLIVESTYGARLHPNRQIEEQRFAEAVAAAVAEGHCLIPAFALGRSQEIILILRRAQIEGRIPLFPIAVDGLVRQVCSAYQAIPEALPPALARAIRFGIAPFFDELVQPVTSPPQREALLNGPPCAIISSSGMLTGGPSLWYAQRLAARPEAAILITGYQDEESPGRALLDLADGTSREIMLDGVRTPVHCRVARYSLSAHADGGEIERYVRQLQPRQVALVHGDDEARAALAAALEQMTRVGLPRDGETLTIGRRSQPSNPSANPPPEPHLGNGAPLDQAALARIHTVLCALPEPPPAVTRDELLHLWFGAQPPAEAHQQLAALLAQAPTQFLPIADAPQLYRLVRPATRSADDLVGQLLLIANHDETGSEAALGLGLRPGVIEVRPSGGRRERLIVRLSLLREVVGPWPGGVGAARLAPTNWAGSLQREARRWRWRVGAAHLLPHLAASGARSFAELAEAMNLGEAELGARLGLAEILWSNPDLVVCHAPRSLGEPPRYEAAAGWEAALAAGSGKERPDQAWLREQAEALFAADGDLQRIGIDPDHGAITLHFAFPQAAATRYAAAIAQLAAQTGVAVQLSPQPNQARLSELAHSLCAAAGLLLSGRPALFAEQQTVHLSFTALPEPAQFAAVTAQFLATTGWHLRQSGSSAPGAPANPTARAAAGHFTPSAARRESPLNQQQARERALAILPAASGLLKVGLDAQRLSLNLRFAFPKIAQRDYASELQALADATGWFVEVAPQAHQQALGDLAIRLVREAGGQLQRNPSLNLAAEQVEVRLSSPLSASQQADLRTAFAQQSGWQLDIR